MVTVTFVEHNGTLHAVSAEPGASLMQVAVANLVPGIDGDCGGECRCATCHCYIEEPWLEKLDRPSEDERLMLDGAFDTRPSSRLGCQIKLHPALDGIRVLLPDS